MGVLVVWASAQASAPMCRRLFAKNELLIQELAHLRLELDLAKVNRSALDSSVVSVFAINYDRMFADLVQDKIYAESELKTLIKIELLKLQNKKNEALEIDKDARDQARKGADIYMPKPLGTEFPSLATVGNKISLIESHRALAFMQSHDLKIYRFDEKSADSIADVSAFDFNQKTGKVIYLNKNYQLYEYDLAIRQSKLIGKVPAGLDPQRLKMELSPSGEKLVLYLGDKAEIFEAGTGKYLAVTDVSYGTALGQSIGHLRFINDEQIIFDGGSKLFRFSITSHSREVLKTQVTTIGRWELAANREYVVLESKRDIEVIKIDDNSSVESKTGYFTNEKSNRHFSFVQGSNQPLVFFRHSDKLGIFDLTSLNQPLFDFSQTYTADRAGSRNLINIAISENGKSAVVISQDSETKEIWAEFWPLSYN